MLHGFEGECLQIGLLSIASRTLGLPGVLSGGQGEMVRDREGGRGGLAVDEFPMCAGGSVIFTEESLCNKEQESPRSDEIADRGGTFVGDEGCGITSGRPDKGLARCMAICLNTFPEASRCQ